MIEYELVKHKLAIQRKSSYHIPLEIHSQQHVICASILLLYGAIEYHGIEIIEPEVVGRRRVVRAEGNDFKKTEVELLADVDT